MVSSVLFPSKPDIKALDSSEKLEEVLKREQEDCTACRITGATAFMGLGAYSYFSGMNQLRKQQANIVKSKSMFGMQSRQAGITTIAITLAGLGFYRLVN